MLATLSQKRLTSISPGYMISAKAFKEAIMQIFISWSGQLSKELGEIFYSWIPGVLQFVKPYFTPDDVEKGSRWSSEIAKELQESQIGVIVLTRENLLSPWIMFEAGALSKQMEKSRICPILFGLENTDLVGPLVQFQATSFVKEDMEKLVSTINSACGEQKLENNVLDDVFEMWWPKLEKQISSVLGKRKEKEDKAIRSDRELIEEILSLSRISMSRTRRESRERINPAALEELALCYRELKGAVDLNDKQRIEEIYRRMNRPLEYIFERAGMPTVIRERIIRERPRLVRQKEEVEEIIIEEESEEE